MIKRIDSPKNDQIKYLMSLQSKSKLRKEEKTIVFEGRKEIELALKANINIHKIFFISQLISFDEVSVIFKNQLDKYEIYELSEQAYNRITYRESTGGIVVTAEMPNLDLNDMAVNDNSVFIVLESVEKPGNLGAITRIADGAGIDGIIVCDPITDIYNPNAIRSSLGCVFTTKIASTDFDSIKNWLNTNDITSFAAELNASEFYHNTDLSGKIALVFGTEATGLTDKWLEFATKRIKIPMLGKIDSLNVSTSVAILTYEAIKQRNFNCKL